jgi:hypothetical protein
VKVLSMMLMVNCNHDDNDDDVVATTTASLAPVRGTNEPVAPVN